MNSTTTAGKFFAAAIAAALATLGLAALTVWQVDPYDRFGNNRLGVYFDFDRFTKQQLIRKSPHDALLLGSSKIAYIDPDALQGYTFFNAALVGAVPEELLGVLKKNAHGQKHVVIGLDFYMFNERESAFVGDREFAAPASSAFAYLTSLTMVRLALETIWRWATNAPQTILPDGQRNPAFLEAADRVFDKPEYQKVLALLEATHYRDYSFSERRIAVLEEMRNFLAQNGVRYTVFINPLNERIVELIDGLPARVSFERFRTTVRNIFPDVVDLSVSKYSGPENFYYSDPWHFRAEVGAAFVNEYLGTATGADAR